MNTIKRRCEGFARWFTSGLIEGPDMHSPIIVQHNYIRITLHRFVVLSDRYVTRLFLSSLTSFILVHKDLSGLWVVSSLVSSLSHLKHPWIKNIQYKWVWNKNILCKCILSLFCMSRLYYELFYTIISQLSPLFSSSFPKRCGNPSATLWTSSLFAKDLLIWRVVVHEFRWSSMSRLYFFFIFQTMWEFHWNFIDLIFVYQRPAHMTSCRAWVYVKFHVSSLSLLHFPNDLQLVNIQWLWTLSLIFEDLCVLWVILHNCVSPPTSWSLYHPFFEWYV